MTRVATAIGPADHGRQMSLDEFDRAEGREGHLYELSRGVITVVDVPGFHHFRHVEAVRKRFDDYRTAHPGRIYAIGGSGECKILVSRFESERHPDVLVYKQPPDDVENPWPTWVPELVVEVVSSGSGHRDYVEKREEYLAFGVREYWIVDAGRGEGGEMLVLRRMAGRWVERVVRPPEVYRPRLFPGFELDVAAVFRAAAG